jgi:hypothetical protein
MLDAWFKSHLLPISVIEEADLTDIGIKRVTLKPGSNLKGQLDNFAKLPHDVVTKPNTTTPVLLILNR